MTTDWFRVTIHTLAENAETLDEVLEGVGYLRLIYGGEAAYVLCGTRNELFAARLALEGFVEEVCEEDLALLLREPADADRVGEVLRDTPTLNGAPQVTRQLWIDVRDDATLVAIRAAIAGRLIADSTSIEVLQGDEPGMIAR
ncbi:hypothetical protein [Falsiroseomonas oryziterrae]|uniref:hypothetical protein n=1 Tax=Falsiroseomonas oryziterrae TaxID=2911368 RepID=UPI001F1745AD|nr:hypothetical protein [Roseomonas sp. NPKOSM-4]